jgi:hypothetical protein
MALEDVKGILASEYPEVRYRIIPYCSPKKRENDVPFGGTHRVIRQRLTDENQLEFTVSPFQNNE